MSGWKTARSKAMNLTNETYLIRLDTTKHRELYFKERDGWCKVSTRGRRFRATAEQVLNHLLPALAGLAPAVQVKVEHYADPSLRPLPAR
jgi:hypothetical protein